jgi:hypothetical protein
MPSECAAAGQHSAQTTGATTRRRDCPGCVRRGRRRAGRPRSRPTCRHSDSGFSLVPGYASALPPRRRGRVAAFRGEHLGLHTPRLPEASPFLKPREHCPVGTARLREAKVVRPVPEVEPTVCRGLLAHILRIGPKSLSPEASRVFAGGLRQSPWPRRSYLRSRPRGGSRGGSPAGWHCLQRIDRSRTA